MDVTVIVTSYGDEKWRKLAKQRAVPSAADQALAAHLHLPEVDSLGDARNKAVEVTDPKGWICFLDADDELEDGYIEAMEAAVDSESCLYAPALRTVVDHNPGEPCLFVHRDMMKSNPCPIGTLIHRDLFDQVGGFWNEPAYEDWSLFRRAFIVGDELQFVPDAVYRAHVDSKGRNSTVRNPKQMVRRIIASHDVWQEAG